MSPITIIFAVSAVVVVTQHVLGDVAWMRQALTDHFSRSRHPIYPGNRTDAQEFIKKQFTDINLDLHLHTYTASVYGQKETITITAVNIIGILKGKYFNTTDDTLIAIGAHYDTVAAGPGVNDNGAGVVVMLEAARKLAAQGQGRCNTTVLFIAFDLEEEGYNGSAVLVRDWMPTLKGWQNGWKGIYVLDTVFNFDDTEQTQLLPSAFAILFPDIASRIAADKNKGNFIAGIGRTPTETEVLVKFNQSWFKQGNEKYKIEVVPIPEAVIHLPAAADLTRSDHINFWNDGKEAIFITDTADFRGYMKECYHQKCDDSSYITDTNLQFALKLANSLVDVINNYASLDATSSSGGLPLSTAVLVVTTAISLLVSCAFQ